MPPRNRRKFEPHSTRTVLPTPGPSIAWDDEAFRRWLGGQVVGMLEGVFTE